MKRLVSLLLIFAMCGTLCACDNANNLPEPEVPEIPEEVRIVQRKIDKALESEATYSELVEIRELYNDLLMAEQEQIVNYDKIKDVFELSEIEVATIYAVHELQGRLKNPSSLELISVSVTSDDEIVAIKISYSAANNVGGTLDDEFYCLVDTPIHDENTDKWSCKLEDMFQTRYSLEIVNALLGSTQSSNTSQDYASKKYTKNESGITSIDVKKIMDNIGLNIDEIVRNNQ